jgi:xanthosine utilization system XapX-like protein
MNGERMGGLAFLAGMAIAILAGLVPTLVPPSMAIPLLGLLGLVVGLLNITDKETTAFLVATIALVVSTFSLSRLLNTINADFVVNIVNNIAVFAASAAVLVALKAIYVLASEK